MAVWGGFSTELSVGVVVFAHLQLPGAALTAQGPDCAFISMGQFLSDADLGEVE